MAFSEKSKEGGGGEGERGGEGEMGREGEKEGISSFPFLFETLST